jgi:hypothetical protein
MTAIRITESSGSVGTIQVSSGNGGFLPGKLLAGNNIIITSSSNGSFFIESIATGSIFNNNVINNNIIVPSPAPTFESSRKKLTYFINDTIDSGTPIKVTSASFDEVNFDSEKIDVVYNGQLLHTGSFEQVLEAKRDYFISGSDYLIFSFPVLPDDIIDTIINKQKYNTNINAADINGAYVVLSSTSSLPYHRVLTSSNGILIQDNGPSQNIEIKLQKQMIFNEVLSGNNDGINTRFLLNSIPYNSESVSIFVNGQLQTPQHLGLNFYDYNIIEKEIYFHSGAIPSPQSVILTIYEKLI